MTVKVKKKPVYIIVILLAILIPAALIWIYHNTSIIEYDGIQMRPSSDIADNLTYSEKTRQFNTLIRLAGFDTFLHQNGPYTVFVPSDQAFGKLSTDLTGRLRDPNQEGLLREFLLFHIVKGEYHFSDLKEGLELTTIQGDKLVFNKTNGYWNINGYSYFETYDIDTKNGVIHIMTNALIPTSMLQ